MPEPTHDLRLHLRCAADRAVESAVADAEARPDAYSEPAALASTAWVGLTGFADLLRRTLGCRDVFAECLEESAGILLRAAVWLRRSG